MLSALSSTPTEESLPRSIPVSETLPYGWRYRLRRRRNGTEYYQEIPLTEADFLDPQEGDRKMQNPKHARCTVEIFNRLDNYYAADPTTGVFFDLKMDWGIPDLKKPAPDISVIPHLREKDIDPGSFKVKEQGTRPSLVMEVMSPHYQGDDTVKVKLYCQAGVKEYFIVNPYAGDQRKDYRITGYRLVGQQYEPIEPDSEDRLWSETTGLFFGVSADKQEVILTAANGEKLLTPREEQQARVAAERQAHVQTLQRQAAEERAKTEAQARLEAEMRLQALEARVRELETKS
jgi:Uma2 family endonuclease